LTIISCFLFGAKFKAVVQAYAWSWGKLFNPGCHLVMKDEHGSDVEPLRRSPTLAGGSSICLANRGARRHCRRRARECLRLRGVLWKGSNL